MSEAHTKHNNRQLVRAILLSFLAGVVWLVAMRFVTLKQVEVHYHANFAVFVDGQRLPLDRFTYYEEVATCGGEGPENPKIRAHMHDNINHVVHVHDNGVTWGHFFANIGFTDGDTVFRTDSDTYVADEQTQIHFILNGEDVDTTANRTIKNEDVLLVSIGQPSTSELQSEYNQIERDAAIYNQNQDPSSCSGAKPLTAGERLKKAIGIFWD